MKKALFVGRFQPFHMGHLMTVKRILKSHDSVIIMVGSANESGTPENPFSAEERIDMIKLTMEYENIRNFEITSLEDFHDDEMWSRVIMSAVKFDSVYTNNPWTARCFRKKGIKVNRYGFYHKRKYSGREIRKRIMQGDDWKSLVPPAVYGQLKRIKGDERIRKLGSPDPVLSCP